MANALPPPPVLVPMTWQDGRLTDPWNLWLTQLVATLQAQANQASPEALFVWAAMLRGK